jgi:energy-coupling factor transporter ATP-binding protein EcfA2
LGLLAVSQLVLTEPGFPVDLVGTTELHATFREESRTSLVSASPAMQEIREAIDLNVVFSQGKPHLAIFISPR